MFFWVLVIGFWIYNPFIGSIGLLLLLYHCLYIWTVRAKHRLFAYREGFRLCRTYKELLETAKKYADDSSNLSKGLVRDMEKNYIRDSRETRKFLRLNEIIQADNELLSFYKYGYEEEKPVWWPSFWKFSWWDFFRE